MKVTLEDWLRDNLIQPHRTSSREIGNLMKICNRDLEKCRIIELGPDWRLSIAHNAALQSATAAFAADGFGGALVGQSLVALWFSTKFGLNLNSLSLVFFFSSLLSAASTWVSVRIAERIGLLKTMVFTHIPSSVFLIAAAFSPFAWMAVSFYQLRSVLSQMDVPARESYTMAVVEPDERVAMAGIGGVGRSGASVMGPAAGTALWNALGSSAPFVGCGIFKVSYDLLIYTMFRKVKPPEEDKKASEHGKEE